MGGMFLSVIHSVKFHSKYNGLARYSKEINNKKLIVATNFYILFVNKMCEIYQIFVIKMWEASKIFVKFFW